MSAPLAAAVAGRGSWLCDLDGTLVDSCPAHEDAFRQAVAEYAPARLASFSYPAIAGASTAEAAALLAPDPGTAALLARRKQRLYRESVAAGRVALFPGARALLDLLNSDGRTAYLVTGGSRASVERVLAACALTGAFRAVLTSDDVPTSKPDPLFYTYACRRWDLSPADAVALEDSPNGLASALGAGLRTLHVHTTTPHPGALPVPDLPALVSALGQEAGR